jgi:ammonium transporter Rh
MTIHAFGAYFGLAVSMILSPKGSGSSHPKNNSK